MHIHQLKEGEAEKICISSLDGSSYFYEIMKLVFDLSYTVKQNYDAMNSMAHSVTS